MINIITPQIPERAGGTDRNGDSRELMSEVWAVVLSLL